MATDRQFLLFPCRELPKVRQHGLEIPSLRTWRAHSFAMGHSLLCFPLYGKSAFPLGHWQGCRGCRCYPPTSQIQWQDNHTYHQRAGGAESESGWIGFKTWTSHSVQGLKLWYGSCQGAVRDSKDRLVHQPAHRYLGYDYVLQLFRDVVELILLQGSLVLLRRCIIIICRTCEREVDFVFP